MKRYISRESVNGKPCALRGASTVWRGDCTNQYSETIQGGVFLPYHWTGHPSRLNRETSSDMNSETYAKEELVAEITSMFVSAETGIPQTQEHFEGLSSKLCKILFLCYFRKTFHKLDIEVVLCLGPVAYRHRPFLRRIHHSYPNHF